MLQLTCFAAAIFSAAKVAGDTISAQPLSIPPSQFWEGNDGQWSTVYLDVGSPAQQVRLLPGTSATAGDAIWVVLEEGCSQANPTLPAADCAEARGGLFTRNASTTWSTSRLSNDGLFELDTYEEAKLGLTGNAYYGFDTVSLRSGLPVLSNQLVAGFATNDFWLGSLGLSPLPINFTALNEPVPSLLGRLVNTSAVPSASWGYTAGAVYKEPPIFASLTFGGYDASRQSGQGISVPFGADISRDLLVGLNSITFDTIGSSPLLTQGIYVFVDSLVTHLWLPLEVCQAFETAFGLTWNDTTELYLLNETTHARLRAQNPTFTFQLGVTTDRTSGSNSTTTVTLPYAAFDVNVTQPFVNTSQPYFPLKRAQNSTQYTLGRVFLQEAYVLADYDRRNFTIGQAAFPQSSARDLKAVLPPGFVVHKNGSSLSSGAIAGIAVGAVAVIVLLLGLAFYLRRRKSRSRKAQAIAETPQESTKDEKDHLMDESGYNDAKPALQSPQSPQYHEAYGSTMFPKPGELGVTETYRRSELHGGGPHADKDPTSNRYELAGEGIAASELESPVSRGTETRTDG